MGAVQGGAGFWGTEMAAAAAQHLVDPFAGGAGAGEEDHGFFVGFGDPWMPLHDAGVFLDGLVQTAFFDVESSKPEIDWRPLVRSRRRPHDRIDHPREGPREFFEQQKGADCKKGKGEKKAPDHPTRNQVSEPKDQSRPDPSQMIPSELHHVEITPRSLPVRQVASLMV